MAYKVGDKVSLKKRGGTWFVVEVLRGRMYKVTNGTGNGVVIEGGIVTYNGVEYTVLNLMGNDQVRIQHKSGHNKVVNINALTPKDGAKSPSTKHSGGYETIVVTEDDINDSINTMLIKIQAFSKYDVYTERMKGYMESAMQAPKSKQILDEFKKETEIKIEKNDVRWLGSPLPQTYQELIDREEFQNMELYNQFRDEKIKPIIKELTQKTFADILTPVLKYNDREIGMFDFNRASINLLQQYQYYSVKLKKVVPFSDVIIRQVGLEYQYLLKTDYSQVVIIPIFEDGSVDLDKIGKMLAEGMTIYEILAKENLYEKLTYYSTIRKCYLNKEKLPKPSNAVRLFVNVGANAYKNGEQLMYSGLCAIALTEMFELLGYKVNINANFGWTHNGVYFEETKTHRQGGRCIVFLLKRFDESLDVRKLLYITADASYFRTKVFDYMISIMQKFKDKYDEYIGSLLDYESFKDAMFQHFLPKDKQKGIMYHFIGNIYNEQACVEQIRNIILLSELANKQARENYGTDQNI